MSINAKRVVASIEARMTSTRLPGKVLKTCMGRPMLELLAERVRRSQYIDAIVVATTTNKPDEEIVDLASRIGIESFRGSENDVVARVTGAMEAAEADVVVQLTGDCPLLDPEIIDQVIRIYAANTFDYVSNCLVRSFPRGLDVQVASLAVLQKSLAVAKDDTQHEHVFLSVYENPERFRLFNIFAPPELCRPDWRWTIDTLEDYACITRIYEMLYPKSPHFSSRDVALLLLMHPEIAELNQEIRQKQVR
ncbi:MAG: glycosyltransferase family protein [Verrucomicrobia bacterium]|nr:glycosyltransferase family protein [Verrucomicrobiota bacterium]